MDWKKKKVMDKEFWRFVSKHIDNVGRDYKDNRDWFWDTASTNKSELRAIEFLYEMKAKEDDGLHSVRVKLKDMRETRDERRKRRHRVRKAGNKKIRLKNHEDEQMRFDTIHKKQIIDNDSFSSKMKNGCYVCGGGEDAFDSDSKPCPDCSHFFERWIIKHCEECNTTRFLTDSDVMNDKRLRVLLKGLTYPIIKTLCNGCGGNLDFELKYQKYESGIINIKEIVC